MGSEIDLLRYFPRAGAGRHMRGAVSPSDQAISKQFGFDYFDGSRQHGYGGYSYDPRYWTRTVDLLARQYELPADARILDVGCAKGFTLFDFLSRLPVASAVGLDISAYALAHRVRNPRLSYVRGSAEWLPFADNSFDFVFSINTLHNLPEESCLRGLSEIQRVSRGKSYVVVDGWRSPEEEANLRAWVLTAETMMSVTEWQRLFARAGYQGDYSFWSL